jgi:Ca2+-binding RTX toxin-like protein
MARWSGYFGAVTLHDVGSPDDPAAVTYTQFYGILSTNVWTSNKIAGTSDDDIIFMDRTAYTGPRLVGVENFSLGAGDDVLDLTSTRYRYGDTTAQGGTGDDWLLGSSGKDHFFGNAGADRLKGYGGNDTIDGGAGSDLLAGGKGQDTFVFSAALSNRHFDTIIDFSSKADGFSLDNAVFEGMKAGKLSASAIKLIFSATSTVHVDGSDRILYDKVHGDLYFDQDGSGTAHDRVKFAHVVENTVLHNSDFFII